MSPSSSTKPIGGFSAQGADIEVGSRIRSLRKGRQLSLETMAAATGLSIGFLSQIERGLSSPTLRALTGLADAMDVSVAELLQEPDRGPAPTISRAGDRSELVMWASGITKAVLAGGSPTSGANYSFCLMNFDPKASSGEDLYSHQGLEAGYVVQGRLLLSFGQQQWTLAPGDSFHFSSKQPHRFENLALGPTILLLVNLHNQDA